VVSLQSNIQCRGHGQKGVVAATILDSGLIGPIDPDDTHALDGSFASVVRIPILIKPTFVTVRDHTGSPATDTDGVVQIEIAGLIACSTMVSVCSHIEVFIHEGVTIVIQTVTTEFVRVLISPRIVADPSQFTFASLFSARADPVGVARLWNNEALVNLAVTIIVQTIADLSGGKVGTTAGHCRATGGHLVRRTLHTPSGASAGTGALPPNCDTIEHEIVIRHAVDVFVDPVAQHFALPNAPPIVAVVVVSALAAGRAASIGPALHAVACKVLALQLLSA